VSRLYRNSDTLADAALVSTPDTSRATDKCPVLFQRGRTTSEAGASIDQERFTQAWILAWNPSVQLEKHDAGELSLSSEPKCLSLQADDSTTSQERQEARKTQSARLSPFFPPVCLQATGGKKGFVVSEHRYAPSTKL